MVKRLLRRSSIKKPSGSLRGIATTDPDQQLSQRQIMVILGAVMSGMFLAALDMSIVGVAMPAILSDLHGLDYLSWVVTAYLLTSTATTPLWGKFSDLYGRRLSFQLCIGIFLVGSVLCALSGQMGEIIAARAVQGIGGGGLMAVAIAIIGDVIPPRERGRYQGYFGAVFGTSSVMGPLLGGWLAEGPGWRWIFWINIPFGIAALIIISIVFHVPQKKRTHSIDYLGAAVIVASITCLLLYLNWAGQEFGWGDPLSLSLLVGALLLVALFVWVEFRAKEPIIPMELFKNNIYTVGGLYSFLIGMAMFGAVIFLPLYLQMVKGMTPTHSGLAMFPMVIGIAGTSMVAGKLVSRTGRYKVFPVIGASLLVVAQILLSQLKSDTSYAQLAGSAFLLGVALGFSMQTVMVAIQNAVPHRMMGTATSSAMFFRQTGSAVGTAVFGAVMVMQRDHNFAQTFGAEAGRYSALANDISGMRQLPQPQLGQALEGITHAMDAVFLAGIPVALLALGAALLLKEIPLHTTLHRGETDGADQEGADQDRADQDRADQEGGDQDRGDQNGVASVLPVAEPSSSAVKSW